MKRLNYNHVRDFKFLKKSDDSGLLEYDVPHVSKKRKPFIFRGQIFLRRQSHYLASNGQTPLT